MARKLGPRLLLTPVHFFALGAGAGLAPRAPGTAGSVLGLLLGALTFHWVIELRAALVVGVVLAGIWICGESARRLGVHDHPGIVFDEIAGMLATLLAADFLGWLELLLAFVLFRFFDIVKPWPIREVDHRLGGGLGIMLDDLMAAAFAAVCLQAAQLAF